MIVIVVRIVIVVIVVMVVVVVVVVAVITGELNVCNAGSWRREDKPSSSLSLMSSSLSLVSSSSFSSSSSSKALRLVCFAHSFIAGKLRCAGPTQLLRDGAAKVP